jgi:hypothetical protein
VIHLGFADDELKSATRERDTCAAWRQRDFDFFTSQEFRQLSPPKTSSSSPGARSDAAARQK